MLILAAISIATLTGDNGILTKADTATRETDIVETKEQIKLEIMGNSNEDGNYTNDDVIVAVKKITNKEVEENAERVLSKKNNEVDISDLWKREKKELKFFVDDLEIEFNEGDTWYDVIDKVMELNGMKSHGVKMIGFGHPIEFKESAAFYYYLYLNGKSVDIDDLIIEGARYNISS